MGSRKKARESGKDGKGVSCNKCRPTSRVVDNYGCTHRQIPNVLIKSIFSNPGRSAPSASEAPTEVQWKAAAADLSHKLIQATRKRDEAILEASKLKYAMAELESKLNRLEIYCHGLKSDLEDCYKGRKINSTPNPIPNQNYQFMRAGHDSGKVIEHFLVSVSEARSKYSLCFIEVAEKYSGHLLPQQKNKFTLRALLNCYCVEKMKDKALALFQKMDELRIEPTSLDFSNLVSLHMRLGKPEKVPPLVEEMKKRNVEMATFTYSTCMNSLSSLGDSEAVERVFEGGKLCD